ncbi:YonK protein [compost metagenome]
MSTNVTGLIDSDELTVTYIDPQGKEPEKVYDLKKIFGRYNGLETSITFKVDSDIQPDGE